MCTLCVQSAENLSRLSKPPKVSQIPPFPRLVEDNVRKGFLTDEHLLLPA